MRREWVENDEGVHIMCGEFTLCGDSFDAPETEDGWTIGPFVPTSKRTITCPRCAAVVTLCRGVRVNT